MVLPCGVGDRLRLKILKLHWASCSFILVKFGNLSRKLSGFLAHHSTGKWKVSSVPHCGWFSSVSLQKVPDTPPPSLPWTGRGQMAVSSRKACPENLPRAVWRASGDEAVLSSKLSELHCASGRGGAERLLRLGQHPQQEGPTRRDPSRGAWQLDLLWQVLQPAQASVAPAGC